MMKEAGVEGRYTNHLLRATTATRMYEKGVDEQLIKEVTGHKSDVVRIYKHTSKTLMEKACKTVVEPNICALGETPKVTEFDIDQVDLTKSEPREHVSYQSKTSKCHKAEFCHAKKSDKCGGLCQFLKKLDKVKRKKRDVKRLCLSLKFGEKK